MEETVPGSPVLRLVDFTEIKEFVGHASAVGTFCLNMNAEVDEVHAEPIVTGAADDLTFVR